MTQTEGTPSKSSDASLLTRPRIAATARERSVAISKKAPRPTPTQAQVLMLAFRSACCSLALRSVAGRRRHRRCDFAASAAWILSKLLPAR
jgi:Flp pilus assembly protein CpaB